VLFGALALFFRLRGRDPLRRKPGGASNWTDHPGIPEPERYARQF
jgi:hypothetical protein